MLSSELKEREKEQRWGLPTLCRLIPVRSRETQFLLEVIAAFTAPITWQCNFMTGAALKKNQEIAREREREGERERKRERKKGDLPPTHTLQLTGFPFPCPLVGNKEVSLWDLAAHTCYSVLGHQLSSGQSQKIKEGKKPSKLMPSWLFFKFWLPSQSACHCLLFRVPTVAFLFWPELLQSVGERGCSGLTPSWLAPEVPHPLYIKCPASWISHLYLLSPVLFKIIWVIREVCVCLFVCVLVCTYVCAYVHACACVCVLHNLMSAVECRSSDSLPSPLDTCRHADVVLRTSAHWCDWSHLTSWGPCFYSPFGVHSPVISHLCQSLHLFHCISCFHEPFLYPLWGPWEQQMCLRLTCLLVCLLTPPHLASWAMSEVAMWGFF